MVLGKLPVPGRPTIWMIVGQVRCGWGLLGHFFLFCPFSPLSPSLWETARYRLKYCLKGPAKPKTTNQNKARFHVTVITQINKSVVYFNVRRNAKFGCSECKSVF